MTGAGEEDGFFDALANGPVSASDPRAQTGFPGGNLVAQAAEPQR
jgi:conjugal transfer pilus assembly protein TraF